MAVFTHIEENELRALLAQYDLGDLISYEGISEGIQNTNFSVNVDKGRFILTIYEDDYILGDLPFFFAFMEHLVGKNIPCAAPVHTKDGNILLSINNKPAAIVGFLPGRWPKTIKTYHCAEIGKYSALMHNAANDFTLERSGSLAQTLRYRYEKLLEKTADIEVFKPGLGKEIKASYEEIMCKWPIEENLPSGVVHGDIFPDNVLFDGETVSGIIDFYMSHNDCYVADLANTLTQWCFEPGAEFNITKAQSMLQAYNRERNLSKEELDALPTLASAGAMRWFLTRLYDWFMPREGALVQQKDPLEQLEMLRFHLQVNTVREYGFEL